MLGRTFRRATAVALATGALWAPAASAQHRRASARRHQRQVQRLLRRDPPIRGPERVRGRERRLAQRRTAELVPGGRARARVAQRRTRSVRSPNWVERGRKPDRDAAGQRARRARRARRRRAATWPTATSRSTRPRGPGAGLTSQSMQYHDVADIGGAGRRAADRQPAQRREHRCALGPAVTLRSVRRAPAARSPRSPTTSHGPSSTPVRATPTGSAEPCATPRSIPRPLHGRRPSLTGSTSTRSTIPQADEQQRLLANLVIQMNMDRTPLPRFWYLPHGYKAAVVMTGDDHAVGARRRTIRPASGRTSPRVAPSPTGSASGRRRTVDSGIGIPGARGTSTRTRGSRSRLHLNTAYPNSNAGVDRRSTLEHAARRPSLSKYPGIRQPADEPERTASTWSDWASKATERNSPTGFGSTRTTTTGPRPGSAAGPGCSPAPAFPQRFADHPTAPDRRLPGDDAADRRVARPEPPVHIRSLIDGAISGHGYYGVFTANMHTDEPSSHRRHRRPSSTRRKFRGVPVVSAAQMLDWLDGRNGSSFRNISYAATACGSPSPARRGSRGLQAHGPGGYRGGRAVGPVSRRRQRRRMTPQPVKGMNYVRFPAADGNYVATYGVRCRTRRSRRRLSQRDDGADSAS